MLIDKDFLADSIEMSNAELESEYKDILDLIDDCTVTFKEDRLLIVRMLYSAYENGYNRGRNEEILNYD